MVCADQRCDIGLDRENFAGDVTVGVASPAVDGVVTVGVASPVDLAGDVTVGVSSPADLAGDVV